MEVRIRHSKDHRAEAVARCHRVVCDQPVEEGGSDLGMTPPELFLASLGCCAMHYAADYMRARRLALEDIELRVSAVKGSRPARLVEIEISVDAPGLSSKVRAGLTKAIEACLLDRTLANPPRVKVSMTTLVKEGPPSVPQPVDLAS